MNVNSGGYDEWPHGLGVSHVALKHWARPRPPPQLRASFCHCSEGFQERHQLLAPLRNQINLRS